MVMGEYEELVVVHLAPSVALAEIALSVLRSEGIKCGSRATDRAVGVGDGIGSWGPQQVLVRQSDAEAARALLDVDDAAP